jgi:hypothetical protein
MLLSYLGSKLTWLYEKKPAKGPDFKVRNGRWIYFPFNFKNKITFFSLFFCRTRRRMPA